MKIINRCCCIVGILLCSACALLKWHPTGPQQQQCLLLCKSQQLHCQRQCLDSCSNCGARVHYQANMFYHRYANQAQISGKPIFSSLQSFNDLLQCNKNTCDCQADFLLCKQYCLDKIQKRLKIYRFC